MMKKSQTVPLTGAIIITEASLIVAGYAIGSAIAAFDRAAVKLPLHGAINLVPMVVTFLGLAAIFMTPWIALRFFKNSGRLTAAFPENAAGGAALALALTSEIPDFVFRHAAGGLMTEAAWSQSPAYRITESSICIIAIALGSWTALTILRKDRSLLMILIASASYIPLSIAGHWAMSR